MSDNLGFQRRPHPDGGPYVSQVALVGAILKWLARHGAPDLNHRQVNAVIEAANTVVDAVRTPHAPSRDGSGLDAWLASGETGLSSRHMAHVLAPLAGLPQPSCPRAGESPFPYDPAEVGRCLGLLRAVPELRPHLPALAAHGPVWAGLVAAWDELEALYAEELPTGKAPRLYARMQAIRQRAEAKDAPPG